jgi:hypothetical protein
MGIVKLYRRHLLRQLAVQSDRMCPWCRARVAEASKQAFEDAQAEHQIRKAAENGAPEATP